MWYPLSQQFTRGLWIIVGLDCDAVWRFLYQILICLNFCTFVDLLWQCEPFSTLLYKPENQPVDVGHRTWRQKSVSSSCCEVHLFLLQDTKIFSCSKGQEFSWPFRCPCQKLKSTSMFVRPLRFHFFLLCIAHLFPPWALDTNAINRYNSLFSAWTGAHSKLSCWKTVCPKWSWQQSLVCSACC